MARPQSETDINFDKLPDVQKMYIKRMERFNKGRAKTHIVERSNKRLFGVIMSGLVIGIYAYTMIAMKQERLGEEYDQHYQEQVNDGQTGSTDTSVNSPATSGTS